MKHLFVEAALYCPHYWLWVHHCWPEHEAVQFFLQKRKHVQHKKQRVRIKWNISRNHKHSILLDELNKIPFLSFAFTSAPKSRSTRKHGSLSASSLARSRGLLSWIYCRDEKVPQKVLLHDYDSKCYFIRHVFFSPCPSCWFQLHEISTSAPCLVCSSTLQYVRGCSTTQGLEQ